MSKKIYTDEELRERRNAQQKEYAKRTNNASKKKYQKTKVKRYTFDFTYSKDSDIIEHLEDLYNKSAYIKQLIRDDILREYLHENEKK